MVRHTAWLPLPLLLAGAAALSAQNVEQTHRRACDAGDMRSCTLLGLIHETGAGSAPPNVGRAIELYQRACDRGAPAGCTRLALAQQAPPDSRFEDTLMRVGYIADAETGEPIAGAVIELPDLSMRVLADDAGRVDLGTLPRGTHRLFAGRLGYERVDGQLPVPWESDFLLLMNRVAPDPEDLLGGIFGRVVEEGTGRDLAYVDVALGGNPPRRLVTGPDGRFSISGLDPGPLYITLSLIGYEPRSTTVTIEAGQTLELHATLATQVIELAPIEVVVGSGYLRRSGFYRRSITSIGFQVTRRELDLMDPVVVSDVLLRVPGVSMVRTRAGAVVPVTTRNEGTQGQGGCRLRPYLDGMAMFEWDFDNLRPDDLEAIEIYQGPGTPIEYQNLLDPDGHSPCGVILIWTTRGRR